jgi:AraC family transcriptional regulator, exoenzyme S synthesis regulatory protein ExsA
MIVEQHFLTLFGKRVFSLMDFEAPLREELPISSDACFTYFIQGDAQTISITPSVTATSEHFVLSLCGTTMGNMLASQQGRIRAIIVHFVPEILKRVYENEKPLFWSELDKPITKYIVQMAATNLLRHWVEGAVKLFENSDAASDLIVEVKLKELILLLLQTSDNHDVSQIMRSLFSEKEFSFKEKIEAHIYSPVSVEDLAKLTNTSVSTFKREFAKTFNETPAAYINNRRLERVAQLLKITDTPVSAIGYDCGFATPANLSKAFKMKYQKTPSEYRLEHLHCKQ